MAKPDDCVRVVRVLDEDGKRVGWTVEGSDVKADEGAATLVYTYDAEDASAWPPLARAAFVCYLARELCIPITGRLADLQPIAALTNERMGEAAAADVNEGNAGSPIVREVVAVLRSEAGASDADLAQSADALAERIEELLEPTRRELMSAHRWNFARATVPAAPTPDPLRPGRFTCARPPDCVRIEKVNDMGGSPCEWTMRGVWISAERPPATIVYVRDEDDLDLWPPSVRRALVYRLAADASLVCATKDRAHPASDALMRLYEKKLSDAAVQDAREGNPGRSAWGRSRFADSMRGGGFYGGGFGRRTPC